MTSKQSPKPAARKAAGRTPPKSAKKPAPAKAKAAPRASAAKDDADGHGGPTSPSELSAEVMEFITAIDKYKRLNRRPFPSWCGRSATSGARERSCARAPLARSAPRLSAVAARQP
jgi:hypothetical protein